MNHIKQFAGRKFPVLKNKSTGKSRDQWYELVENKEAFYQISNVLARYYKQFDSIEKRGNFISESQNFRDDLISSPPEMIRVFCQRFTQFEYLIYAEIRKDNNVRSDYWIHIDGILEEREEQKKINNRQHPAFSIVCLTDLFEKNCRPVTGEMEEYLQK